MIHVKIQKKQKTIGIVVFRREGGRIWYLLLHHSGRYWNFPKGRQEAGESQRQTALRELEEETGITEIKLIRGFRDGYDYNFQGNRRPNEGMVYKQAIFFLGQTLQREVIISDEHQNFGWFGYAAALKKMTYKPGRDLLQHAHQFLLKQ